MDNFQLVNLVYLDIASGPVRLHSGVGTLSWDGVSWVGAGNLGGISSVGESLEIQPAKVKLSLSGLPAELVRVALDEHYQGRRVKIWLALIKADNVMSPQLIFSGRIDTMQGLLGNNSAIAVQCESRLADWQRAQTRRYTKADQAIDYPADRGFDYVSTTAEQEILWGFTR